jgi:hypothetical protein
MVTPPPRRLGVGPEVPKLPQEATLKGLDDWVREAAQTAWDIR